MLDGVPEEEDRRQHERDAGDPGEELDADEALPVERERRLGGGGGGVGRGDVRRGGFVAVAGSVGGTIRRGYWRGSIRPAQLGGS